MKKESRLQTENSDLFEDDEKPAVKVYKSRSNPNTTVTKIKSKPSSDGSVKKKTIQDTKLPDGKKSKVKTVTKIPGGGEKVKKKSVLSTGNRNATKITEVKVGKNSTSKK